MKDALPLAVVVQLILCVPALGPAIVKPCVVGTTARAASENVRSLGYSIYYTLVNIGGTLGPIMAFAVRRTIGIENVFRVSAVCVLLMFFGTVFFYKEPDRLVEKQVASFAQAFRNMFVVLGNLRFMAFLLIFSGFWIMFWQEFIALPLFIRGYVNPNADVDLLTTVDPLAVILFQILISFLTRKIRPFAAMIAGILITSLSWLILAVCDLSLQINTTMRIGSWELPVQGLPVYAVIRARGAGDRRNGPVAALLRICFAARAARTARHVHGILFSADRDRFRRRRENRRPSRELFRRSSPSAESALVRDRGHRNRDDAADVALRQDGETRRRAGTETCGSELQRCLRPMPLRDTLRGICFSRGTGLQPEIRGPYRNRYHAIGSHLSAMVFAVLLPCGSALQSLNMLQFRRVVSLFPKRGMHAVLY